MIEKTGDKFNLDTYMSARKTAMKAALLFAQHVNVGMNFKDMEGLLSEIFMLLKIEKKWHMSKIRIGRDTLKTFKEKSDESIELQENDIYFLDIGPVIDEHEAGVNGEELYTFLESEASKLGYELDPKMKGHRLGDFPHHVHFRGNLTEQDKKPIENLWVLEVHLLDKENNVGAFFEDILTA